MNMKGLGEKKVNIKKVGHKKKKEVNTKQQEGGYRTKK